MTRYLANNPPSAMSAEPGNTIPMASIRSIVPTTTRSSPNPAGIRDSMVCGYKNG